MITRTQKFSGIVFLVIVLMLLIALPVGAQTNNDQQLIVIEGQYTIEADGTIHVSDYTIAPGNAFLPPDIAEGDSVSITGYLLPDGQTVQALSIELEEDASSVEDTPVLSGEQTGDDTGDVSDNAHGNGHGHGQGDDNGQGNGGGNGHGHGGGNGHGQDGDNGQGNGGGNGHGHGGGNGHGHGQGNRAEHSFYCTHTENRHPAVERIADEFGVDYTQVIALFCDGGHGIGEILIAYRLAQVSGQSVDAILDLKDNGHGWGNVFHDLDVDPSEVMGKGAHSGD
jgi:hypothetical protein